MKNLRTVDWISVLSFIAGGGLASLVQILGQTWPKEGQTIVNVAAIVTVIAGLLLRLFCNPTGAPAQAIVDGAPIVPRDTTVVHSDTQVVGSNCTLLKG